MRSPSPHAAMVNRPAAPHAVRGIRGATSVEVDDPCAIASATRELLTAIVERNGLAYDDLISAVFTVTGDLTSAFPALAAREMGWADVPLLCALEIPVPGALPHCIRVLLHATTDRPRAAIDHVYLHRAVALRPDLRAVSLPSHSTSHSADDA